MDSDESGKRRKEKQKKNDFGYLKTREGVQQEPLVDEGRSRALHFTYHVRRANFQVNLMRDSGTILHITKTLYSN
jgi:hypothetical protein